MNHAYPQLCRYHLLMAIPEHTFEFEGSHYLRFPDPPWLGTGMFPLEWLELNIERFLYSPAHIVREAEPFDLNEGPSAAGVYFLLAGDRLLYVGKSVEIAGRLNAHWSKGWRFDRYWCFGGIPEIFLEEVEAFYIHALEPPLNEKYPYLHRVTLLEVEQARNGTLIYHDGNQ